MFIQAGCISGWQAISDPVTTCVMQGIAVTIRNSTVSAIRHWVPLGAKEAELSSVGDFARSSVEYAVPSDSHMLLAASVNAYDNGPFLEAEYSVPFAFTGWASQGDVSEIGLRLGVATNTFLPPSPSIAQVDFAQNFAGEDSLTMITRYYTSTGFISLVGSGPKVLASDVSQITLPLHGSTIAGDTVLLVVMSELGLATPSGFTWDYNDKIKGILPSLNELQRNTQLTVYRKVVDPEDIFNGEFTVSVYNT